MEIRQALSAIIDAEVSESIMENYSKEDLVKVILSLLNTNEIILSDRSDMFIRFQQLLNN